MKNFKANEPCCACGKYGDGFITFHHILTRKTYPEFEISPFNLMPLCQMHHNEIHNKGTSYMADKYTGLKSWLKVNGWGFSESLKKWIYLK